MGTEEKSIPAFFAGKSVFVTGATGFMGKVLVEKLLRSCPRIGKIFCLMRPKKGTEIEERIRKITVLPLFDRLRESDPAQLEKLVPISGDTSQEALGLSAEDRKILIQQVSVIFHAAANVRFDDPLKCAMLTNVRSTRDVCELAAQMQNLLALVHVSTAFSQCDKKIVEERIYEDFEVDWKKILNVAESLEEDEMNLLTQKYLKDHPNTYTFTKRLAEQVIQDFASKLPAVVFRPSIVISSCDEPFAGWIDNFNGPVGMMVGGAKGVLRAVYLNTEVIADFVPVDIAIKIMITSAWKRGISNHTEDPTVHVYNASSSDIKHHTIAEVVAMGLKESVEVPLDGIMWTPGLTFTKNKMHYYFLTLLVHILPALLIDAVLKLSGKKAMLFKLQRKIFAANTALSHFMLNQWRFKNDKALGLLDDLSPEDYKAFGHDMHNIDPEKYFRNCIVGAKVYLLKEDMNALPRAKAHFNRMRWIDFGVRVGLWILALWYFVSWGYSCLH